MHAPLTSSPIRADTKFLLKLRLQAQSLSEAQSTMFRRITVGLKGGILRVANAAEVAARLLLLVGGAAPGCGRLVLPLGAVGGCWIMLARLPGSATAGGSWRWCVCGPPVSAGPGSGIRHRGRPFPPQVCRGVNVFFFYLDRRAHNQVASGLSSR